MYRNVKIKECGARARVQWLLRVCLLAGVLGTPCGAWTEPLPASGTEATTAVLPAVTAAPPATAESAPSGDTIGTAPSCVVSATPAAVPAATPAAVMNAPAASSSRATAASGSPSGVPAGTTPCEAAPPASAAAPPDIMPQNAPPPPAAPLPKYLGWTVMEPGLDMGQFYHEQSGSTIVVLRFDPAQFEFTLHMVSREGRPALTLEQWTQKHGLVAAINASMYLPDSSTSTGYMRSGAHVNNTRMGQRLGVFFVAGPRSPQLPPAALIERDTPDWEARIGQYNIVVQNFRLISGRREILWPRQGSSSSIAAVGQDQDGRILFLHCREPLSPYMFATRLLELPLHIRTVMYVEGGVQAGMVLTSEGRVRAWQGRRKMDFLRPARSTISVPNILGVRRRIAAP